MLARSNQREDSTFPVQRPPPPRLEFQSQQIDHGDKYFSIYRGTVLWAGWTLGTPFGRVSFARNWQERIDEQRASASSVRGLVHVGIVSTLREPRPRVRKRSRGEKEIYRGLPERLLGLLGLLGDPILRQSSLVLLGVT